MYSQDDVISRIVTIPKQYDRELSRKILDINQRNPKITAGVVTLDFTVISVAYFILDQLRPGQIQGAAVLIN